MESSHLARLREEQDKAILETDQKIAQWEEMKSNYQALQDRLNSLSYNLSHDIMVPFGPCAFMPGKIVHSNEVMVLLGDNWFVQRSAKQAAEIAGRRLETIQKSVSDLNEQKKLLQPRVDVTSQFKNIADENGGIREIVEEYDSEEEKKWKVKHRQNVKAQKKKEREERRRREKQSEDREEKKTVTDEDLWLRLEELERIETEGRELQRLKTETIPAPDFVQNLPVTKDPPVDENKGSKKIKWQDESDDSYDEESDEPVEQDTTSSAQCTNRITFTHTPTQQVQKSDNENSGELDETKASEVEISSPSDVYKYFGHLKEPKSILKKSSQSKHNARRAREMEIEQARNSSAIKKMSGTAFTGKILEKPVNTLPEVQPPVVQTENKRPVSKFRAARQNQR